MNVTSNFSNVQVMRSTDATMAGFVLYDATKAEFFATARLLHGLMLRPWVSLVQLWKFKRTYIHIRLLHLTRKVSFAHSSSDVTGLPLCLLAAVEVQHNEYTAAGQCSSTIPEPKAGQRCSDDLVCGYRRHSDGHAHCECDPL